MSIERDVRFEGLQKLNCTISALSLVLVFFIALPLHSQSSSGKSGGAGASSSGGPAGGSFAIESEMLTYRAVESNSETIACDLAAYLYKVPATFDKSEAGSKCTVKPTGGAPGVVLLSYDQSVLDSIQLWRADIAIMNTLTKRSDSLDSDCAEVKTAIAGSSNATSILDLTPAGNALSLVQDALGAFSQQTEASHVTGNVQDQAFMNAVARQLNALEIPVLEPGAYAPYSLSGVDVTTSPFLQRLSALAITRDCVARKLATSKASVGSAKTSDEKGHAPDQKTESADSAKKQEKHPSATAEKPDLHDQKTGIPSGTIKTPKDETTTPDDEIRKDIVAKIDAFLNGLLGGTIAAASNRPAANSGGSPDPTQPPRQASQAAGLAGILSVDGLAKQLGIGHDGKSTSSHWQHILMIRALESGGTITKTTNILGSRIRYNGGAVGTFSLFRPDGTLECSGNVFDFGGSIAAKHFEQELRHYSPDLSTQLLFSRGSCIAPADKK